MRHEITSGLHDQAVQIHEPETLSGVVQTQPIVHKGRRHEICDPGGCRAGSEEHDPQIAKRDSSDPRGGVHARQSDSGSALNVVVETQHTIPVLLQERVCVRREEVLELNQRIGVARLDRGDELLH